MLGKDKQSLASLILRIDFLSILDKDHVTQLMEHFDIIHFAEGDYAIRQGNAGGSFFIVRSGRFDVFVEKDGQQIKVDEMKAGDFFGEISLISDAPRSASIVATEKSEVFILAKAGFKKFLLAYPCIAEGFVEKIHERKAANQAIILAKLKSSSDAGKKGLLDLIGLRKKETPDVSDYLPDFPLE